MKRAERMKVLRKLKTPTLEKRMDRICRKMEEAENYANHLRAYYEDINMVINERLYNPDGTPK